MVVLGPKGRTVPPVDSWVDTGHLLGFLPVDVAPVVGGNEPALDDERNSEPAPEDERNSELTDRLPKLGHLE